MSDTVECRFCHRQRDAAAVCRNTRDMDPADGLWDDKTCHIALHQAGGGERGFRLSRRAAELYLPLGRPMTGFLATLTQEQRERALVPFDGDETLGPPPLP